MAIPSVITLASAGVIAAAAVGLTAASQAGDHPVSHRPTHQVIGATPDQHAAPMRTHATTLHPKGPVVPQIPVEVFNNSGVSGLAATKSRTLQGAGWNVVGVDNWYGDIPETTVYYPAGHQPAATKLARLLNAHRIRPSVAPMRFDRLTVILAPS